MKCSKEKKRGSYIGGKTLFAWCLLFLISFMILGTSSVVFAADNPQSTLQDEVYTSMKAESGSDKYMYETEGGGYISAQEVLGTNKDVDEEQFNKLTKKSQQEFVSDLSKASNEAVGKGSGSTKVTEGTVDSWWKQLQTKSGIGSKFLAVTLEQTKPDFVTAQKWYKPFSGPIGTILAFISIVAMGVIGIVIGADILYITVPPFRLFVDDNGDENSGKIQTSKLFSHAAIHAVKEVEEEGKGGHVLGRYFKSRVIELTILAIALLYLVNGQIYNFISWVLDLVSGIL